ncbi:ATP-binding protein [Adlercreutzia sp. ZJ141]|uniref:ATP-binding protein n=1 Tax=Adlercreutzia sp. ZJ141 TaxID=2709406 RepID=UPI001981F2B0|nr:ATP-binding protein [Adlercreutzia sp. ZJ141]
MQNEEAGDSMSTNPFTPTFGIVPAHMAGREDVIGELLRALDNGVGDPNLVTIVSGARGTGKTALLSYVADEAAAHGWIAVNVSALPGMLDEIVQQTKKRAGHLIESDGAVRISSIHLGNIAEVTFQEQNEEAATWRIRMEDLLDELAKTDTGLLLTIDEVREDLDEMIQVASAMQHFLRERRNIALFMAGLPTHVSALLQNKSVSFLRRANYHDLGTVEDFEVAQALTKTIEGAGRSIDEEALKRAVASIGGFPYMLQLVGYRAWEASPDSSFLSIADVDTGISHARIDMRRKIFDTTFKELSKGDVRFLAAMLEDEGASELADIARRMGKKSNYASEYKRRLIEQGVIADRGQGLVRIEIPLFKDYLKERLS